MGDGGQLGAARLEDPDRALQRARAEAGSAEHEASAARPTGRGGAALTQPLPPPPAGTEPPPAGPPSAVPPPASPGGA
jgi:hypothetical protein